MNRTRSAQATRGPRAALRRFVCVLAVAGCSGGGGGAPPSLPPGVQRSPIAGATQAPVGTGWIDSNNDVAGTGEIGLTSTGDAIVAWTRQVSGDTSPGISVTACWLDPATGWGSPVVLEPQLATYMRLFVDRDDAATVAWGLDTLMDQYTVRLRRGQAGGGWNALPDQSITLLSSEGILVGGQGRIAVLAESGAGGTQVMGGTASIYDPTTGWGPVTELGTPVYGNSWAIASDGTVLVAFGGVTAVTGSLTYQTYSTPGGWSSPASWDPCLNASLVPDINGSVFAFCDTDTMHDAVDQPIASRLFANGAWTAGPTFTAMDVTDSAKAAGGEHFMTVWTEYTSKVRTVYGSLMSAQSVDLDTDYTVESDPLVGMDAQGRAVVAWTEQTDSANASGSTDPSRWPLKHVFYARYAPDTGWTAPMQIDGDDGFSHGSILSDLAVNDSGTAMALWVENGATTILGTNPSLWAAVLP